LNIIKRLLCIICSKHLKLLMLLLIKKLLVTSRT